MEVSEIPYLFVSCLCKFVLFFQDLIFSPFAFFTDVVDTVFVTRVDTVSEAALRPDPMGSLSEVYAAVKPSIYWVGIQLRKQLP